jgi:GTP cyclohydrolase IA
MSTRPSGPRPTSLRGVRAYDAKTITSALLGTLRTDPRSRAEFFALAGVPC